jgi:hypothetical protein
MDKKKGTEEIDLYDLESFNMKTMEKYKFAMITFEKHENALEVSLSILVKFLTK